MKSIFLLSLFTLFAALSANPARAASEYFPLKANEKCALELEGFTSIPRLTCRFSLGLKASEISLDQVFVTYDINDIPYADYENRYELGAGIVEVDGTYAFQFTFLDDMLDGFTVEEGKEFKKAVIEQLRRENVTVRLRFNGPESLLNKAELGRVL
jgi:hypothetical protein